MSDKIGRIAEHLADENDALRAENQRLRAALKFAVRNHRTSCVCRACTVYYGLDKPADCFSDPRCDPGNHCGNLVEHKRA